jgi:REP element-mobilizing transposase RayT
MALLSLRDVSLSFGGPRLLDHVDWQIERAWVRLCFWFFSLTSPRGRGSLGDMPRRLRIEYEGAIYHVMARGNARQDIVDDDDDRRRLRDDLEGTVGRTDWELLAFVLLSNHLHLLVKTPRPNLAAGMQLFLSRYALWSGRRRLGHLFQGRYKAELIEDKSYYWTVSRYIHLNPVRAGLTERPEQWPWSSSPGYHDIQQRLPFVAYESLLRAWGGEFGGSDPATAYRDFVASGLAEPPASPFREAFEGWVLGSDAFVDRLRRLAGPALEARSLAPEARRLAALDPDWVFRVVGDYYGLDDMAFGRRHERHLGRAVAAWLCRRYTEATLRALAARLGLGRPDSVPNLTRRVDEALRESPALASEVAEITRRLECRSEDQENVPELTNNKV